FFYYSVVPPALHSFPTRRSSDLFPDDASNVVDRISGELRGGNWTAGLTAHHAVFHATTNRAPQSGKYTLLIAGLRGAVGGGVKQDRKSTRLNSSHDQISYAVFCL